MDRFLTYLFIFFYFYININERLVGVQYCFPNTDCNSPENFKKFSFNTSAVYTIGQNIDLYYDPSNLNDIDINNGIIYWISIPVMIIGALLAYATYSNYNQVSKNESYAAAEGQRALLPRYGYNPYPYAYPYVI